MVRDTAAAIWIYLRLNKTFYHIYFGRNTSGVVAVGLNFQSYIRQYTSPNKDIEYSYPLSGLQILKVTLWNKGHNDVAYIMTKFKNFQTKTMGLQSRLMLVENDK